jgi:hypothetical protein
VIRPRTSGATIPGKSALTPILSPAILFIRLRPYIRKTTVSLRVLPVAGLSVNHWGVGANMTSKTISDILA